MKNLMQRKVGYVSPVQLVNGATLVGCEQRDEERVLENLEPDVVVKASEGSGWIETTLATIEPFVPGPLAFSCKAGLLRSCQTRTSRHPSSRFIT